MIYSEEAEEQKKRDKKLLDELKNLCSKELFDEIMDELSECYHYRFSFVDNPEGKLQNLSMTEFKYIKEEYVNQTVNGGYLGDDFAGTMFILLPNNKYLKSHYYC